MSCYSIIISSEKKRKQSVSHCLPFVDVQVVYSENIFYIMKDFITIMNVDVNTIVIIKV